MESRIQMSCLDETVKQLLQCSICLDAFEGAGEKMPKILLCHHSFCIECLEAVFRTGGRSGVVCPSCRAEHEIGSVDELPNDFTLMKLIEAYPSVTEDPVQLLQESYKLPVKAMEYLKFFQESQLSETFHPDHLSVVLDCMEYYEQLGAIDHAEIVEESLQIACSMLQIAGSLFLVYDDLKSRLIKDAVAAMNTFEGHSMIQAHGVNVLALLSHPSILEDQLFNAAKVALLSLNAPNWKDFASKVVGMMRIFPRELSREDNAVLGSPANIKNLLRIMDFQLRSLSCQQTLHAIVCALGSLTEETPSTCINIVKENGLDLFEKVVQDESISHDLKGDALVTVSNIAEVSDAQKEIIRRKFLVEVFQDLMMSENYQTSFMSASVIARLSVVPETEWVEHHGDSKLHEAVLQELYDKVASWDLAVPLNIKYLSFKPFYPLLRMFDSAAAQLYAVWTIRYCLENDNAYKQMLSGEETFQMLMDVKENYHVNAKVKEIVSQIILSVA